MKNLMAVVFGLIKMLFWAQGGYSQTGGDGASYCEPQKYVSLKSYTQKKTWHQNFLSKKNTRLKYLNTDLFNQTDSSNA